jgi:hypothetical protein
MVSNDLLQKKYCFDPDPKELKVARILLPYEMEHLRN